MRMVGHCGKDSLVSCILSSGQAHFAIALSWVDGIWICLRRSCMTNSIHRYCTRSVDDSRDPRSTTSLPQCECLNRLDTVPRSRTTYTKRSEVLGSVDRSLLLHVKVEAGSSMAKCHCGMKHLAEQTVHKGCLSMHVFEHEH